MIRHDETWWDYWTYWTYWTLGAVRVSTSLQRLPSTLVRTGIEWPRMAMNSHEFTISTRRIRKGSKRSKHVIPYESIWYLFSDSCKVISGDIWWSSNTTVTQVWPAQVHGLPRVATKCDQHQKLSDPYGVTTRRSPLRQNDSPAVAVGQNVELRCELLDTWKDLERSGKHG